MGNLKIVAEIDNRIHQQTQQIDQDLQRIAKRAENSGSMMDNAFGKVGNTLDKMGINLPGLIGPAAAVTAALKFKQWGQEAYEFEKAFGMAMREVQTISKAVQDDFDGISQKLVDMAANGPDSAIKLAKAFYQIVSAGYDGAEGLKLLEISSKAAVAGVTDTKTAADGLTTVLNAWGLSANNAGKVSDVMFKSVERGKTTFSELASYIAQVAPLAASNNVEFEQIFAALQSITKQGTPTAQAMTQIRSSLVNMNKALGDGWANTMTYQDGLNKIAEMAGGSQNKLKGLIPDIEGVSAVLALTGEKAKGAAEDLDETTKAAGAMETAYGRMMLEAENKWMVVTNKWTREVRELGKALKEESGNIANFMDALLSKGTDVNANMSISGIADKIKALRLMGGGMIGSYVKGGLMPESAVRAQYDQYIKTIQDYAKQGLSKQQMSLGDILGIQDKEKRLTKLNEFLVSMKTAEQDLGKTVFRNDEQQNAALKIRGELWGEVEARAKEAIKAIEGSGSGGGETKARTLKTMLDEIKTQQDSLGTGSMKEDITTLARISALQQEVLAYYNKIREARNIDPVTATKTISGKDSLGGVQTITNEQSKQQFQGDKLLKQSKEKTAEAQKQADGIKEQNEQYTRQTALLETLTFGLDDAGKLLGAMSYAIGEFDTELGQSVGKMADLANNAASMLKSFGKGDYVGAVSSGIGVIGNIIGMFKDANSNAQIDSLQQINNLLKQQSTILASLARTNYFQLAEKQYNDLGKLIDENTKKLKESALLTTEQSGYLGELNNKFVAAAAYGNNALAKSIQNQMIAFLNSVKNTQNDWGAKDILDAYSKGEIILNDTQAEWVKSIFEAEKQRIELIQETFRTALGFDASAVSNTIFKGIEDGLKLGSNSLGGFAENFGELMKKALMQSVIDAMELDITKTLLPKYKDAMADGILTDAERKDLELIYTNLVKQGQIDSANIKTITDPYLGTAVKQSPITGIAAQMTEDTGSLVAGQFMAMRVDLKVIQETGMNMLELMDQSLSVLGTIAGNTKPIYRLEAIENALNETNKILNSKL